MIIGNGDAFAQALLNQSANCKNCNTPIKFGDGAKYAEQKGIKGKVVMCDKCKSVFKVELTPSMKLWKDITSEYFTPVDIENMIKQEKKNLMKLKIGCFVIVLIIILVGIITWH